MKKMKRGYKLNEPLKLTEHRRPMTRREFISQGFAFGTATLLGGSIAGLASNKAFGLSADLQNFIDTNANCNVFSPANSKIPFICFDLAGGANIAGSNVLVGGPGGQLDFLDASGYQKQGLPANMSPALDSAVTPMIDSRLGLRFHNQSQMLAGILDKVTDPTISNINGTVIAARSENDTGNNPHNPMYAINRAGADGQVLALIGSRASDSGGNSMAPAAFINPEVRPTKVDRSSDVMGLINNDSEFSNAFSNVDATAIMESIYRLSDAKLGRVNTNITTDAIVKDLVRCGYVKSARITETFAGTSVNPDDDTRIVGTNAIFSDLEYQADREFQKTAAVMKMVLDGYAGAGTITMGGYDYHTGDRATGERRDLRAGRCIGACLEYARLVGSAVMIYVFSDGSVFSNGMIDGSEAGGPDDPGGGDKGVWTGDNQQTAASFFLLYDPSGRPNIRNQLGYMRPSGDVETSSSPMANNVNLLVEAIALNYMAFNGDVVGNPNGSGNYSAFVQADRFPNHGLGSLDNYNVFNV